jgi:hypothetical protein
MSHKLTIELTSAQHKRIKMAASMMRTTVENVVLLAFEILMQRKFNKITEKALKTSEQRRELKKFGSLDELFEDLGI